MLALWLCTHTPSEKAIKLRKQIEKRNKVVTIFLVIFAPYAMMHLLEIEWPRARRTADLRHGRPQQH